MKYLLLLIHVLTPVLIFSQDSSNISNADTTQNATILNEILEDDSTEIVIPEYIETPLDSVEIIQSTISKEITKSIIESDSVELLNICRSSIYVLDSDNLTPLYAERMAEIMATEMKK